jgi:quercetin dioxygenase-like cupin family protein
MPRLRAASWAAILIATTGLAVAQTKTRTGAGAPATGAPMHKMLTPDQITWGPAPPGLPAGAQAAVLDGDPTKAGIFIMRLRGADGYTIKPHWHSRDEHITVLSGKMSMGMGNEMVTASMHDLGPGAYFSLPAGQRHYATMRGDTTVQIEGMGPFDITYVNPSDDPRQKRTAR